MSGVQGLLVAPQKLSNFSPALTLGASIMELNILRKAVVQLLVG
jgi:hypothetical protein